MTVALGLSEIIVDAVVAKLQTGMQARVAAINIEKADGIRVEPPANGDYYTAAVRQFGRAPAILVMDGQMTLSGRGEGPHSLMTETRIGVYVYDEDSDEQRLGRKLQRQTRAVIESLWDDPPRQQLGDTAAPVAWRIVPTLTVPGQVFEPQGDGADWRGLYLTIFNVQRLEE